MSAPTYRILVGDDHTLFRQGIRRLIEELPGCAVVGEAHDGIEAVRMAGRLKPDMVVLDISMPKQGGIEAAYEICRAQPRTAVLILTMHRRIEYVHRAFSAGASGFLLKDDSGEELTEAIRIIRSGRRYVTRRLLADVADDLARMHADTSRRTDDPLTVRERSIITLIAEGNTSRKIADMLCISLRTVQNHRYHIMQKLNVGTTADLIRYAIENGYVG